MDLVISHDWANSPATGAGSNSQKHQKQPESPFQTSSWTAATAGGGHPAWSLPLICLKPFCNIEDNILELCSVVYLWLVVDSLMWKQENRFNKGVEIKLKYSV